MNKLPKFITFDAYGTLINFQLGKATLDVLGDRAKIIDTDKFLNEYHDARWEDIFKPYRSYEALLRRCFGNIARKYHIEFTEDDVDAMIAAIPTWGPFPDVPPVLRKLREYCKIVIISNTEDHIIERNIENIGVPFDNHISAQQARAYKPSPVVFNYTLKKLGCDKSEILHVAQGFEYDIMPAHDLGWKAVWINRYGIKGDTAYGPYDELTDLTGLPALLGI
ncbi:MAG: haloacid dehalogenase, type II [Chloroflexi bacterium RBG_16_54_11]|nr:MAG: haloacid dehalogenase, type II [Chloroflexi bacterium RBG_16_54_11]